MKIVLNFSVTAQMLLSLIEAWYFLLIGNVIAIDKPKSYIPTLAVAKAAAKGLKLRSKFGYGGTLIGLKRARDLMKRHAVSVNIIQRIVSYFARHEVDKKAPNFANHMTPSKGYIAWLLWGGEAGRKWAERIKTKLNKTVSKG